MSKKLRAAPIQRIARSLVDGNTISTVRITMGEETTYETAIISRDGDEVTVVERYSSDLEASVGHARWCSYVAAYVSATTKQLATVTTGTKRRRFALREDV